MLGFRVLEAVRSAKPMVPVQSAIYGGMESRILVFVAIAYPDRRTAAESRLELLRIAPDFPGEFGDSVIASVDGYGTIDLDQAVNLWSLRPKGVTLRTLLGGLLFLYPLLPVLPADTPQLVAAATRDFGLDETFMMRLRQMLTPGHAVVFLLASPAAIALISDTVAFPVAEQSVDLAKFGALSLAFEKGQEAAIRQLNTIYSHDGADDLV